MALDLLTIVLDIIALFTDDVVVTDAPFNYTDPPIRTHAD